MTGFEYKVVPAPVRGLKAKGLKGTAARFANALQLVMNDLGAQGWEYRRTDTLPVEERVGLTRKSTSFQNMLVFRRILDIQPQDTPEVAALIEDQTPGSEDEPVATSEVEDIAVHEQLEPAPLEDPNDDTEQATTELVEKVSLAADERVSETLKVPFSFPWDKRRTGVPSTKDDESYSNAEK
jgi:hypothetical protein